MARRLVYIPRGGSVVVGGGGAARGPLRVAVESQREQAFEAQRLEELAVGLVVHFSGHLDHFEVA
eukprot:CAMPEP_0114127550 /NCGR_PEP_ID=MMETSP0043_2-20121206/10439_1 /TAXON_ID=464988 /ORGANISM="Hemiselmis andersenii, Strain CCMP644" /LENGTH=64 /DNA_ID=CAMNT_0001220641 /DNA_START=486 /DNA_END=680 /DNA_ORIENTATION=-